MNAPTNRDLILRARRGNAEAYGEVAANLCLNHIKAEVGLEVSAIDLDGWAYAQFDERPC